MRHVSYKIFYFFSVASCCFYTDVNAVQVCRPDGDLPAMHECNSAGENIGPDNNHTVKQEVCESLADKVTKETDTTYTCSFFSYRHYYAPDHYGGGEFCELTLMRDAEGKTKPSDMDCFMLSAESCHIVHYCRVYDL